MSKWKGPVILMPPEQTCESCGKKYYRGRKTKYCSDACGEDYRRVRDGKPPKAKKPLQHEVPLSPAVKKRLAFLVNLCLAEIEVYGRFPRNARAWLRGYPDHLREVKEAYSKAQAGLKEAP